MIVQKTSEWKIKRDLNRRARGQSYYVFKRGVKSISKLKLYKIMETSNNSYGKSSNSTEKIVDLIET